MGNGSSKRNDSSTYTQSETIETKVDNNCSDSMGKRMGRGAFMAVNPAGALIARAIRSHKKSDKQSDAYSANDDGC